MSKSVTYKANDGTLYYSPRSLPKKINMEQERGDWLAYLERHGNDIAQAKAALAVGLNEKNAESRLMLLAFAEAFTYKYKGFGDAAIPKDSNGDDILQGEYWLPKEIIKKIKQDKIATTTIQKYIRDEVSKPQAPYHADPNDTNVGSHSAPDVVKDAAKEMGLKTDDDDNVFVNNDEQFGSFIRKVLGYELQEGEPTRKFNINGSIVLLPTSVDLATLEGAIETVLKDHTVYFYGSSQHRGTGRDSINIIDEVDAATGAPPPPEQPKSPPVHPDSDTQPANDGQSNTGAAQQTASQQEQLQQTGAADPPKTVVPSQPPSSHGSFHTALSGDDTGSLPPSGTNTPPPPPQNNLANAAAGLTTAIDITIPGQMPLASGLLSASGAQTTVVPSSSQLVSGAGQPPSAGGAPPIAPPIPPTATTAQIVAAVTTTPDTQIYINRLAVKIADKTSVKVHRKESAVDRLVRRGTENLDKALRFPDRSNAEVLKAGTCASNWSLVNGIRKSLGLIDRASWVTM